ncbi:hypothetical protein Acor_60230 [Acrocarpospora corrugata]|uniref:Peptidase M48 domain-containing protein n=1 Tax=Acrocarpospora corrugata TaxID=35763 RepID=A0A5M3W4G6_9ACTN|nr:M48 family metalloprotease [Acrocarpospora corrugata]GES03957.1 hypothetical protein Acor_60230 [Acrocarpospora corrugata]
MLPPAGSPESHRAGLGLVKRQRVRNRLLMGVLGLVLLAAVAAVATIVAASARDVAAGLAAGGVLVAVMVICGLSNDSLTLWRFGEVHDPERREALQAIVNRMAAEFRIAPPRVRIMDNGVNAVAIGSGGRAHICLSVRLLALYHDDPDELEAVIAHELAHHANGDSWMASVLVGAMMWNRWVYTLLTFYAEALRIVCLGFLAATTNRSGPIVGPLRLSCAVIARFVAPAIRKAGKIVLVVNHAILMALCRHREFAADAVAAYVTGRPEALCAALERIEGEPTTLVRGRWLAQERAIARAVSGGGLAELLSTHPSTSRRIERLLGYTTGGEPFRDRIPVLVAGFVTLALVIAGSGVAGYTAIGSRPQVSYGTTIAQAGSPVAADDDLAPDPATDLATMPPETPGLAEPPPEPATTSAEPPAEPPAEPSTKSPNKLNKPDKSPSKPPSPTTDPETDPETPTPPATGRSADPSPTPSTTPEPTAEPTQEPAPDPPAAAPVRLGGVDFDAYCRLLGAGDATLEENNVYGWRCDGRPLSVTDACKQLYGDENALDKALNYADPESWECWQVTRRLGVLDSADFDAHCQAGGAEDATLVADHAYGWRCRTTDGTETGISVIDVCRRRHDEPAAIDRMADYHNPDSWECWI